MGEDLRNTERASATDPISEAEAALRRVRAGQIARERVEAAWVLGNRSAAIALRREPAPVGVDVIPSAFVA